MPKFNKHVKKMTLLATTALAIGALSFPSFRAEAATASETYLKAIADNTAAILQNVNVLPEYIKQSISFMLAWVAKDDSDTTVKLQSSFTELANSITQNVSVQKSLQQRLTQDYFGKTVNQQTMPYANDLTYQTILGTPFFNPDPRKEKDKNINPAYNYMKNAAGTNVSHIIPGSGGQNWGGGGQENLKNYINYYNTVSAIQTFDSYVVSQIYADFQNGNKQSEAQKSLIDQASSSDWFAQVASEKIGIVLRQILMYQSQSYVLLNRLLEVEQQILMAQSMNNTLLILTNQQNEDLLVKKATGNLPGQI